MLLSLIWMGISYGGGRKDAGHNPLDLDNVIQENHIFIEGLITKEWSDRIIVCNPDDSLLLVAYLMAWDMAHLERTALYLNARLVQLPMPSLRSSILLHCFHI